MLGTLGAGANKHFALGAFLEQFQSLIVRYIDKIWVLDGALGVDLSTRVASRQRLSSLRYLLLVQACRIHIVADARSHPMSEKIAKEHPKRSYKLPQPHERGV